MATIKSFTSVEQSRKLADILPLESADMYYPSEMISPKFGVALSISNNIPCWSIASLLEQLPYEVCDDDGNSFYLQINKENDIYQLTYTDPYEDFDVIETDRHEHFVDACYEMILKLHELKML